MRDSAAAADDDDDYSPVYVCFWTKSPSLSLTLDPYRGTERGDADGYMN